MALRKTKTVSSASSVIRPNAKIGQIGRNLGGGRVSGYNSIMVKDPFGGARRMLVLYSTGALNKFRAKHEARLTSRGRGKGLKAGLARARKTDLQRERRAARRAA